ncbi:MAG: hypothetical protein WCT05_00390 [Lentisphaeria bacterium]
MSSTFHLIEDFSIRDEREKSYHLDIEKNTALSNEHASILADGKYHLALNGNKHFLNTPELRDFRLEMDFSMRIHNTMFGYGFIYYFRHDRRSGCGHTLSCLWDKEAMMHIELDGKIVSSKQCDAIPEFTGEKSILTLQGNQLFFEYHGEKHEFSCADTEAGLPQRGEIGFDLLFSPGSSMALTKISLDSENAPAKQLFKSFDFILRKVQGFSEPLKYKINLYQFQNGSVELEYVLDGTIRGRGKRLESGGGEWCHEIDKLRRPYIRIESADKEFCNILLANELMMLLDPEEKRVCSKLFPQMDWPLRRNLFFRSFPEKFIIATGYEYACHDPWRLAENGPYEMIRDQDGKKLYEGGSIRRDAVGVACQSPADKQITKRIPTEIPDYELALQHAREQHYFFAGEDVEFVIALTWRKSAYHPEEFQCEFSFGDPFGRNLQGDAGELEILPVNEEEKDFWIARRAYWLRMKKNPGCGVYHLTVRVSNGFRDIHNDFTVFEVLSDDPNGPCPPLAAKLPFLLAMPNEIKYLEDDPFNPYGDFGGCGHYFSAVSRYPVVAGKLKIWDLLRVYRRKWLLMLTARNAGNSSLAEPQNRELMKHCDLIDCNDERLYGRYDLFSRAWYKGYVMELLIVFVKERKPSFQRIQLADLEKLYELTKKATVSELFSMDNALSMEQFADLFDTCWEEWVAWFRVRVKVDTQHFVDQLLAINPRIARASYGPYALYVSHYKSPYSLKYGGYEVETDPHNRENGSFYFLEEYHYSCDYPLTRATFFTAGYNLHFPSGRRLYPENYTDVWEGCDDGAVYQAHPPYGFYSFPDCHQRRVVYQYTYGSPQFKGEQYQYWRDYGFQMRSVSKNSFKEFLHAWGNLIDNEPARQLKAPFLMLDLEQIGRHGDFLDDQYSFRINSQYSLNDVCNTAEEALGYTYELLCGTGYNTPVLSTFEELDKITPDQAEMVILPPIVKNTPKEHLDAIRRAHARGINLLCFEAVCGLEDLFGVCERKVGAACIVDIQGDVFEHKLALAHYENNGGSVLLYGASEVRGEQNVPLVIVNETKSGRTAFINLPPTLVKRENFRYKYSWGRDAISVVIKDAMRKVFTALCPSPTVHVERGTINAAWSVHGDIVVVLGEDSPIYGDATVYPVRFCFKVCSPGIGQATIASDALYAVVSKTENSIRIRTETEKDTALFFKFSISGLKPTCQAMLQKVASSSASR